MRNWTWTGSVGLSLSMLGGCGGETAQGDASASQGSQSTSDTEPSDTSNGSTSTASTTASTTSADVTETGVSTTATGTESETSSESGPSTESGSESGTGTSSATESGGTSIESGSSSNGVSVTDASSSSGVASESESQGSSSGDPIEPECDGLEFSYIWIANTPETTVSKIDTFTGVEVARYLTSDQMAHPSRTSVNLYGDVAIGNRGLPGNVQGGESVVKIAARESDCIDNNQNGMIDTSSGANDVLAWGQDECVLWSVSLPDAINYFNGPRPVQWEPTTADDPSPRLWIGYGNVNGDAVIQRLDGFDGAVLDEIVGPNYQAFGYGPYGGTVNAEGDLFVSPLASGTVLKIDSDTLMLEEFANPGVQFYGIGVDAIGNPWITGYDQGGGSSDLAVFDDATDTFSIIDGAGGHLRGIQIDAAGRAWAAGNSPCRLVEIDVATMTVTDSDIALPGCGVPVGVSIDACGFVWVVDQSAELAYKVDPDTHEIVLTVDGLVQPYTYSDMTGGALNLLVPQ